MNKKLSNKIKKNRYGYYELLSYKSKHDEVNYFEKEYYQNETGSYCQEYSKEEIAFFKKKALKKELIIRKYLPEFEKQDHVKFLEIGSGEGYTLAHFHNVGFDVTGIDLSNYGIHFNNPQVEDKLLCGDCRDILPMLINKNEQYDIISSDMTLDMLTNPGFVIDCCKKLLNTQTGIFWLNVSNNYSMLQMKLLDDGILDKDYWLDEEGHPSYFNPDGLKNLMQEHGFERLDVYGESFIDLYLTNDITNYYLHPNVGKNCYKSKMYIENLMMNISMSKTIELEKILGEMGFGRTTTGIFRLKKNE